MPAWLLALAAVACALPLNAAGGARTIDIDARDVAVGDIAKLIASQGGPTMTVRDDVADEKVTFAAKGISPGAAVRWLCRTCTLAVVSDRGRLVLGRASLPPSEKKEYRLSRIVTSPLAASALVSFIEKTIFGLHPNRMHNEQGELAPVLQASYDRGRLEIVAPEEVQREVVALLKAMSRVTTARSVKEVTVTYRPWEIGFLSSRTGGAPGKLQGKVDLEVSSATAHQAACALTSASKTTFFVDPWDKGLGRAKLTFQAEGQSLAGAAHQLRHRLGAELCWYDEAWLLVRDHRRGLFDNYLMRVYNLADTGPYVKSLAGLVKGIAQGQALPRDLPYSMERVGDLWLIAAPPAWHEPIKEFVKNPAEPPRFPWKR